jgi:hypothetical protein
MTDTDQEGGSKTAKGNLSSLPEFEAAIGMVENLVKAGALWWKMSLPAFLYPRLDEQMAAPLIGAKDSDERRQFERILSREILTALNRAAGMQLGGRFPPERNLELSPQEKTEFETRAKVVRDRLYTKSLEERVLIRKTSKGPTLEDLRWDISIKKHDLGHGTIPNIPYATIEIVLASESMDGNPLASIFGGDRKVHAFDCHLGDLDAMIRDLTDLRKNLQSLTESRGT